MPVILVITKFDVVISKVIFEMGSGCDAQQYELARVRAHEMYNDSCRRLFHKDPITLPAEIVSGTYSVLVSDGHLTPPISLSEAEIR